MTACITSNSLAEKIDSFNGCQVLIIGDVMLDHYQYGSVERISPEAPVPIVKVEHEEFHLGGAANVAKNIKRLGGTPFLIGLCGQDQRYRQLQGLLHGEGIEHEILTSIDWRTTVKTRVVAQGQQVLRVDQEVSGEKDFEALDIIPILRNVLAGYRVVLISDYGKGMITKVLLDTVHEYKRPGTRVLVDPKTRNFQLYSGAFLITPNLKEASEGANLVIKGRDDLLKAGSEILNQDRCQNLLITLGPDGMVLFCQDKTVWKIPTMARKVYDVTGAGDTVIAVIGGALSAGLDIVQACVLANYAAGIVVGQLGAAAITAEELKSYVLHQEEPLMIQSWQ